MGTGGVPDFTEVLTAGGWLRVRDVTGLDHLAIVYLPSMEVTFSQPASVASSPCDTQILKVSGSHICTVTHEDHRVALCPRQVLAGRRQWEWPEFHRHQDVWGRERRYVKAALTISADHNLPIDPRFIGFFVGDGYSDGKRIEFNLKRQRKIRYMADELAEPERQSDGPRAAWLRVNCYTESGQKKLPDSVCLWSSTQIDELLDGLRNSDGSPKHRSSWTYATVSERLIDQIQGLLPLVGLSGTVQKGATPKGGPYYRLVISRRIYPIVSPYPSRSETRSEKKVRYSRRLYHIDLGDEGHDDGVITRTEGHVVIVGGTT